MTLAASSRRVRVSGQTAPRIAPPVPAKSLVDEYRQAAGDLGLDLMPWQDRAARYLTATVAKRWRYREVCIVVARQNGKSTLLIPRIYMGLRRGERILHTAQNRALPRETFLELARLVANDPNVAEIRFANGQELIRFVNGGKYSLVAPRPGVRGFSVDTVLLDEVREQHSYDLLAAIKPTLTASRNPQLVYLSNAGDEESVVLNDLRRRDDDDALAYLEWSATPERERGDLEGWREANPALGVTIQLDTLRDFHRSLPAAVFETEHLCRWVLTMAPKLVSEVKWDQSHAALEAPLRPFLGISMDPSGTRASAVMSWQQTDGTVGLRMLAEVYGDPIDTDALGQEIKTAALRAGVPEVGFDDWTDKELARYFKKSRAINGREFANASENFVRVIEAGRLRWDDAESVGGDLPFTARKPHESGAWAAVKASDDRPITAALAAIRAVWLASGPAPSAPRIH